MYRRFVFAVLFFALAGASCASAPRAPRVAAGGAEPRADAPALSVSSTERWRVPLPSEVVGIPAVTNEAIYVSTEQSVVALHHDGTIRWSAPLEQPRVFAPVVAGDLVLVAGEHWLAALRRDTGAPVWQFDTGSGEGVRVNRPAVVGDVVVAATDGGRVLGVERDSGALRWEAALGAGSGAQIAVHDAVAVVVGVAEWAAFDAPSGAVLWSGDLGFIGTSSPVVVDAADGALAVVASENKLIAVGLHDGQIRWTAHAEQSEHAQVPVVSDGELLVPDHWGRLTAYRPGDGASVWKTEGADGVAQWGEPVVLGTRLVAMAMSQDGPRIASPTGAVALRPPAQGWGVSRLPDGALVVSTYGEGPNYLVAYDLDIGG